MFFIKIYVKEGDLNNGMIFGVCGAVDKLSQSWGTHLNFADHLGGLYIETSGWPASEATVMGGPARGFAYPCVPFTPASASSSTSDTNTHLKRAIAASGRGAICEAVRISVQRLMSFVWFVVSD